jgi:hypothetical protein
MKLVTLQMLGASEQVHRTVETSDSIFITHVVMSQLDNPVAVKLFNERKIIYGTAVPYSHPSGDTDIIAVPDWIYNLFEVKDVDIAKIYPEAATFISLKPYQKNLDVDQETLRKGMSSHFIYQSDVLFPLNINNQIIWMKSTYNPNMPCVTIRNSFVTVNCEEPNKEQPIFIGKGYVLGGSRTIDPRKAFIEALRKRENENK